MADVKQVLIDRSEKIPENLSKKSVAECKHCKKPTCNSIQCGKCENNYHSACLIQSATQKSAKCRHVPAYAVEDSWTHEKGLYEMIIALLEEKNKILQENNRLMGEKMENLEKSRSEVSAFTLYPPITNPPSDIPPAPSPTNVAKPPTVNEKTGVASGVNESTYSGSCETPSDNSAQKMIEKEKGRRPVTPVNFIAHPLIENSVNKNESSKNKNSQKNNRFPAPRLMEREKQSPKKSQESDGGPLESPHTKKNNKQMVGNSQSDKNKNEDSWKTVSYGKKRQSPVIGGCKNFQLQVAQKKTYLFVSGFAPTVTEEEIQLYIKTSTGTDTRCYKMKTKNSSFKSSFKIEVFDTETHKIMIPDIWGEGVIINHFTHNGRSPLSRAHYHLQAEHVQN